MALNDMVFDRNMNPAYIHTPSRTRNWLKYQKSQGRDLRGYQVRLGDTMQFVFVVEYLSMNHAQREGTHEHDYE
ncbi:hypothetical protein SEA_KARDASHIAN_71 [Streptomyces phage Kardashian]|nr:hypothetical protein SEA_KARDASHIAN_71 [Streptomyces phage Kardashian]